MAKRNVGASLELDLVPLVHSVRTGDPGDVLPVFTFHSSETIFETSASSAAFIQDQKRQATCLSGWKNRREREKKKQRRTHERSVAVSGETSGQMVEGVVLLGRPDLTWPLTSQKAVNQRESAH